VECNIQLWCGDFHYTFAPYADALAQVCVNFKLQPLVDIAPHIQARYDLARDALFSSKRSLGSVIADVKTLRFDHLIPLNLVLVVDEVQTPVRLVDPTKVNVKSRPTNMVLGAYKVPTFRLNNPVSYQFLQLNAAIKAKIRSKERVKFNNGLLTAVLSARTVATQINHPTLVMSRISDALGQTATGNELEMKERFVDGHRDEDFAHLLNAHLSMGIDATSVALK
jgi:hypothetical protein